MIKKIFNKINSIFFKFNPSFKANNNLTKIGTIYGGYDIYNQNLEKPIILSCGLGEDASFDIDMINKFDAKVIILDPTPRSKVYFNKLKEKFGNSKNTNYDESGNLNPDSYDLRKTNSKNLIFVDKAIWSTNDTEINLYFPKVLSHVSLSINKKSNYSDSNSLKAKTVDYSTLLKSFELKKVDILKLDIEGAEIETLKSVLKNNILPNQILVEFDLRRKPSLKTYLMLRKIHKKICQKYKLININKKGDFTYVAKKFLN